MSRDVGNVTQREELSHAHGRKLAAWHRALWQLNVG